MKSAICNTDDCPFCAEFEEHASAENDICRLKQMRKNILRHKIVSSVTLSDKFAGWLAAKVGTMGFFYLCNVLCFIPVIFSSEFLMKVIQFISSSWLQLILLPVLAIVANRQDTINQAREEREFRIMMVGERIEELHLAGIKAELEEEGSEI